MALSQDELERLTTEAELELPLASSSTGARRRQRVRDIRDVSQRGERLPAVGSRRQSGAFRGQRGGE